LFEQATGPAVLRYQGSIPTTANRNQTKVCILEVEGSATRVMFAQDSEQVTGAAPVLVTNTGGFIGDTDVSAGYTQQAYFSAFICYGRVLNTTEKTAMQVALQRVFSSNITPTKRVMFDGDSIVSAGTSPTVLFYNGFTKQVTTRLPPYVAVYNAGSGGSQIQTKAANYAATGLHDLVIAYSDRRVVFLLAGTNDLTIGARTAAQIYADIQTYAGLVRADGGKIIVSTILPNSAWDATQQTTRNTLNTSIRTNWASFADGLADFALDPVMGPQAAASDLTLYLDGLHPTELGNRYLAQVALSAINALL
jgi:lysophospholipase L1-like esterase